MADLKKLAEELVNLTVKDVKELAEDLLHFKLGATGLFY